MRSLKIYLLSFDPLFLKKYRELRNPYTIEIFSVTVSFSIFGIGWYSYDQSKNQHSLLLSVAFLTVGILDLMHTLSYVGMPNLISQNTSNKASQFWIIARMVSASALLLSAFVSRDQIFPFLNKRNLLIMKMRLIRKIYSDTFIR